MQTILGANGTIARDLARDLKQYTQKIRLVSRNPKQINGDDELMSADLTEPTQVARAVKGSEVVYLLVGFDYNIKVWRENWPKLMRATINACVANHTKLVFFDNVYLYDRSAIGHMTEESPVNPPSEKGKVRAQIVQMIWDAVKSKKLTALIARSADFYGPGNEKSFLLETVYKNFKKGKKANWFIDAGKMHSFTFTPDAAKATALLGNTSDAFNQTWHLPTDPQVLTGVEWMEMFAKEMKAKPGLTVLPMWMLKILGIFMPFMREMPEMMYQYDRDYLFDSSKFTARFNMRATPYAEGIKAVVGSR